MKMKILGYCVVVIALLGIGAWFLHARNDSPSKDNPSSQTTHTPFVQLNILESDVAQAKDKGSLSVAINSSNFGDISRVVYLLDGEQVAESKTSPFAATIDISDLQPGKHTVQAIAYGHDGKSSKSEIFTFTIEADQEVKPSGGTSRAVLHQSVPGAKLVDSTRGSGSGNPNSGGSHHNSGGDDVGENNGGDGDGDGDPTDTFPNTPPAEICGNTSVLSGPSVAPAGAITVPAGDNSALISSLEQDDKTYWFAPGTHKIGTGEFSQIAPGDNTTFTGAPGAVIDGQHLNKYAFSGKSNHVKIQYLTIKNFIAPRDEGVVNHNSGVYWTIQYLTAEDNGGGAVFAGSNNTVRYNCLKDNGQYGFQVFTDDVGGVHDVVLDHNEISGNNTDDWETQVGGCGCTGGGKFWDAHTVNVTNNYVHNNLSVGLWADTNDTDFLVEGNYISDNDSQGLFYEISYNMIVRNNNFIRNSLVSGPKDNSFPSGAIYLSESGGDSRVAGRTANIEIYDNKFTDNWAGVILWENADRFCASPANTSSGTCTLVSPSATLANCTDPSSGGHVDEEPYYSDCRWKTQNVKVHNNEFTIHKDSISQCNATQGCGMQGLFSNSGSFPAWSPYMGDVIQQDITFNQNNLFSNNTYTGDWDFMAQAQGSSYNFALWQARFGQDSGSTINGQSQYLVTNALDVNTATLEGNKGSWTNWFNVATAQSTDQAHTGTHSLKVTPSDPFWGVESDSSGFPITPANKTISFWGKMSAGTMALNMEVHFVDGDDNPVGSTVTIPLTINATGWVQASQGVTTPAGAESVIVNFDGGSGTNGVPFYLDDVVVADRAS